VARHRVAGARTDDAARPGKNLGGLQPVAADQPVPDGGDDSARMGRLHGGRGALEGEGPVGQPWHSTPYQALPPVYVQNASLEIAWTRVVFDTRTIAGNVLTPFLTEGYEGFDINDAHDWMIAERLIADGKAALPPVPQVSYGAQWVNSNETRSRATSSATYRPPSSGACWTRGCRRVP